VNGSLTVVKRASWSDEDSAWAVPMPRIGQTIISLPIPVLNRNEFPGIDSIKITVRSSEIHAKAVENS